MLIAYLHVATFQESATPRRSTPASALGRGTSQRESRECTVKTNVDVRSTLLSQTMSNRHPPL